MKLEFEILVQSKFLGPLSSKKVFSSKCLLYASLERVLQDRFSNTLQICQLSRPVQIHKKVFDKLRRYVLTSAKELPNQVLRKFRNSPKSAKQHGVNRISLKILDRNIRVYHMFKLLLNYFLTQAIRYYRLNRECIVR